MSLSEKRNRPSLLPWLCVSAVGLALLAIVGAHAPVRIKFIGLYAVLYSALAGWGLAQLARSMNVGRRSAVVWSAALLTAASLLLMAYEGHRVFAAQLREEFENNPETQFGDQMLQAAAGRDDPESSARHEAMKKTFEDTMAQRRQLLAEEVRFGEYLRLRVLPLGEWSDPWPALFWVTEVLLGGLTGAGVSRWMLTESRSQNSVA